MTKSKYRITFSNGTSKDGIIATSETQAKTLAETSMAYITATNKYVAVSAAIHEEDATALMASRKYPGDWGR